MQSRNRNTSGNTMIRISLFLFCLVMISFAFMSGFYARYVSKDDGGDSARVAKFDVVGSVSPSDVAINLSEGAVNGNYTLQVTNNSEVAIRYTVTLTFAEALPEYVTVMFNSQSGTFSADRKTLTFTNGAALAPAAADTAKSLVFTVNSVNDYTANAVASEITQTIAFQGTINCVQID